MTAGDTRDEPRQDPTLRALVSGLQEALGGRLLSVVLYGSAGRGDRHPKKGDLNVIVVLSSLDPKALEAATPAIRAFVHKGHPVPRLFSPDLIADSADTFPVEFVDIRAARVVLHGADPFAAIAVRPEHLRLQIEREMKEKLMRLREAYVLIHDGRSELETLLVRSYPAFAALFRGGLHLMNRPVPAATHEAVSSFCRLTGLDPLPFEEIAGLRRGETMAGDPKAVFARYYGALTRAAADIDRLILQGGETR